MRFRLATWNINSVRLRLDLVERLVRAERPDIYRVCQAASLVILAQAFAGAIVVWTTLSYVSTLLHAGLMAMLFVLLCVGCRLVLPVREPARSDALSSHGASAAPART